jgi:pimeloyl-ACP methyl ester carboxylesterase
MLAFDRHGDGPPLILLHGTNSSRSVWRPLLVKLVAKRQVLSVDLPAHGDSPPSSYTPPEWARDLAALLDDLGFERAAVVGHSSGGWAALELAKLGRAGGVLALAPAGLWRKHSPVLTDAGLRFNWRLGQALGDGVTRSLRSKSGRRMSLRQISARPAEVPADVAIETARDVLRSKHFPEHFKRTRRLRFTDGDRIEHDVPVHVVWGEKDRVARARTSRHEDQLPGHAVVETWKACGHMLMWDAPDRVVAAALELPAGDLVPGARARGGSP